MPVTPDQPAPYAPASAIIELIQRHRSRGLPSPVDAEVLARAGVADSLIPRTLQALQTLDLIEESGAPSQVLESIRLAPEGEYKQRLAQWLNAAYADALAYIDPATASESEVRDAFRGYRPIGQQQRMVSLFTNLYAAAGIGPEKPPPAPRKPKPSTSKPARKGGSTSPSSGNINPIGVGAAGTMPPPLAGLMASLPPSGQGWSKAKRDSFIATFEAVLDFCIPVVETPASEKEEEAQ